MNTGDGVISEGMMKGPDNSFLRFAYDSVRNEPASANSGRAIFDTMLYVDVITPGQKSSTPRFELERVWASQSREILNLSEPSKKYAKYAELEDYILKFKRNDNPADMEGTPLKEWPPIDRGLAATLAALNVFTVEQLATVADVHLGSIGMGARDLREQARQYLANALDGSGLSQLTQKVTDLELENSELKATLAVANSQLREMSKQLATLKDENPKPPPTGRVPQSILPDITLP